MRWLLLIVHYDALQHKIHNHQRPLTLDTAALCVLTTANSITKRQQSLFSGATRMNWKGKCARLTPIKGFVRHNSGATSSNWKGKCAHLTPIESFQTQHQLLICVVVSIIRILEHAKRLLPFRWAGETAAVLTTCTSMLMPQCPDRYQLQ
jgi:hypothetical protein